MMIFVKTVVPGMTELWSNQLLHSFLGNDLAFSFLFVPSAAYRGKTSPIRTCLLYNL